MCDGCVEDAYAWGYETAGTLERGLVEVCDLHGGRLNAPENEHYPTGPYCPACSQKWPCVTFLTAVGALNDVR